MNDEHIISAFRIQKFIKEAQPRDRMAYFVGNLAAERIADKTVAEVAQTAYDAAVAGQCVLLQKRYGRPEDGAMLYLIERRAV